MTIVTDLPEDILAIIFSLLDAKSFLTLCQTCRDLYQFSRDPAYWRNITSSTFRLPVSPLLKADGARWYSLYRRLRTQTKLYTWGQGLKGNLGPGRALPPPRIVRRRPIRTFMNRQIFPPEIEETPTTFTRVSSSWPTEVHVPSEVGVIADLQCGGFSTSILSSEGQLFTVGLIDSFDGRNVGESSDHFRRLEYLTQSTSAIQQFSAGRRHVLALTDDGDIISWDRLNAKGLKVFSRHGQTFGGKAVRVGAGWGESSAYIPETGIVYWIPIANDQQDDMLDGIHIKEKIIPGTARNITKEGQPIEVVRHVVLESWIVWVTSIGKLYACELHTANADDDHPAFPPFEVPGYTSSVRVLKDVQGQFNKFAVFTETGEVLAGNTDYLRLCAEKARTHVSPDDGRTPLAPGEWSGLDELTGLRPRDIPALQHNQVISLAFGDHHYHALHINGKITSYGNDPQSCGALGMGDLPTGSRFRGLVTGQGWRPDSKLIPQAESRGRQIWFEPEKREWLKYMEERLQSGQLSSFADNEGTQHPPIDIWLPNDPKPLMFSEWIEQEGRHWQEGPIRSRDITHTLNETSISEQDFHLDAYFALAVSAAGWHSGALVLVDQEKAETVRRKWVNIEPTHNEDESEHDKQRVMPGHFEHGPTEPPEAYIWNHEGFPKVRLPDGFEMPGDGEVRPWRDGPPTLSELGLESAG